MEFIEQILNAKREDREEKIKSLILHSLTQLFSLPEEGVPDDMSFFEMGMESLTSETFCADLQFALQGHLQLNAVIAFNYPTINLLASYIEKELFKDEIEISEKASLEKPFPGHEPIAIIGASCRLPGGVNNVEDYWKLLLEGVDPIQDIPPSRWDIDQFYDPDPDAKDKMYIRQAGFLDHVDQFDPLFFGISPQEALTLDPQQRLILEVAWEALEVAGIAPGSLKGALGGVFIGILKNYYEDIIRHSAENHEAHVITGNLLNMASGRLSYTLGLKGPSMIIDTASSSSLVAICEACQSLRLGESDIALSGGVNLLLTPDSSIDLCKAGMLSPDARCKSFDKEANGFIQSEGCGIVVLKRLKDAINDGDPIMAIIEGFAINQNGSGAGITVPSVVAQQALVAAALRDANLHPQDIDYVETHGTGTRLGDPIELEGLKVLSPGRKNPLLLGAGKSFIGHTEAAAGVSSLIKLALSLKNEMLIKVLHFSEINPRIDLKAIPSEVLVNNRLWKRGGKIRRGGVSSLGLSGTNAHVILAEAPLVEKKANLNDRSRHIITISAKTEIALKNLLQNYQSFLNTSTSDVADIAYTANTGRNHERYRIAIIAKDLIELKNKINKGQFISGEALENKVYQDFGGISLEASAEAYVHGAVIDWKKFNEPFAREKVLLPTYPFQRERYWVEILPSNKGTPFKPVHPLLGEKIAIPDGEILYRGELNLSFLPYLKDHKVYGYIIYPAAAYMEMMLAGSFYGIEKNEIILSNISIEAAQSFPIDHPIETQLVMKINEIGYEVAIYSRIYTADLENSIWRCHARGLINVDKKRSAPLVFDLESIKFRSKKILRKEDFYFHVNSTGIFYGEFFQAINKIYIGQQEVLAELKVSFPTKAYLAHPALLDSALQLLGVSLWGEKSNDLYLPIACDSFELYAPLKETFFAYWKETENTGNSRSGNFTLCTPSGEVLAILTGMQYRKTSESALRQMLRHENSVEEWFYEWTWEEETLQKTTIPASLGHWLVLSDGSVSQILTESLEKKGAICHCISIENHPKTKEDFIALLQLEPFKGILHVSSCGEGLSLQAPNISKAQNLGVKSFLHLTKP